MDPGAGENNMLFSLENTAEDSVLNRIPAFHTPIQCSKNTFPGGHMFFVGVTTLRIPKLMYADVVNSN